MTFGGRWGGDFLEGGIIPLLPIYVTFWIKEILLPLLVLDYIFTIMEIFIEARFAMRCGECEYLYVRPGIDLCEGTCRRNAPIGAGTASRFVWPRISLDDWCGEFSRDSRLKLAALKKSYIKGKGSLCGLE